MHRQLGKAQENILKYRLPPRLTMIITFHVDHVRHPGRVDDVHGLPDHPEALFPDCHHPLHCRDLHVSDLILTRHLDVGQ